MKSPEKKKKNEPRRRRRAFRGDGRRIAERIASDGLKEQHGNFNDSLFEPGGHSILVYDDLRSLGEVYSQYAKTHLAMGEIVLIATQYEGIEAVKRNLEARGVNVERHLEDGTLFIIDAQQGYQSVDVFGTLKLAMTLASRAEKEERPGVSWFGDVGSFFAFKKMKELLDYELGCPRRFDGPVRSVCCYHAMDFETLSRQQKKTLFDHHFKTIRVEGQSRIFYPRGRDAAVN